MRSQRRKRFHYRIDIFALGSIGGGRWETSVTVWGYTVDEAYSRALAHLSKKGHAFSSKIILCQSNGEDIY